MNSFCMDKRVRVEQIKSNISALKSELANPLTSCATFMYKKSGIKLPEAPILNHKLQIEDKIKKLEAELARLNAEK